VSVEYRKYLRIISFLPQLNSMDVIHSHIGLLPFFLLFAR
jgi:hypothetical protein